MEDPSKSKSATRSLGLIVGGCVGAFIAVLGIPDFQFISPRNTAAPADSLDLAVIAILISSIALINGIVRQRHIRQRGAGRHHGRLPLRRPAMGVGSTFLRYQLVLLFVLFVLSDDQSWTATSVGFTHEVSIFQFGCGLIAYAKLQLMHNNIYR